MTRQLARLCRKHRGMETAEEGICEVAGALLLAHVGSPCELVEALVIVKEDGEWPEWANKVLKPTTPWYDPEWILDALAAAQPGEGNVNGRFI